MAISVTMTCDERRRSGIFRNVVAHGTAAINGLTITESGQRVTEKRYETTMTFVEGATIL